MWRGVEFWFFHWLASSPLKHSRTTVRVCDIRVCILTVFFCVCLATNQWQRCSEQRSHNTNCHLQYATNRTAVNLPLTTAATVSPGIPLFLCILLLVTIILNNIIIINNIISFTHYDCFPHTSLNLTSSVIAHSPLSATWPYTESFCMCGYVDITLRQNSTTKRKRDTAQHISTHDVMHPSVQDSPDEPQLQV